MRRLFLPLSRGRCVWRKNRRDFSAKLLHIPTRANQDGGGCGLHRVRRNIPRPLIRVHIGTQTMRSKRNHASAISAGSGGSAVSLRYGFEVIPSKVYRRNTIQDRPAHKKLEIRGPAWSCYARPGIIAIYFSAQSPRTFLHCFPKLSLTGFNGAFFNGPVCILLLLLLLLLLSSHWLV